MPPTLTLKVSRRPWLLLFSAALVIAGATLLHHLGWRTEAKSREVKIESALTLHAKGRGGANINFANGATIPTEYSGHIEFSQARPLSLAAADFDGDGVDDLMSGYATPNGGLLTLHRGNFESIFPGPATIQPAPFFPEAKTFAAVEQPDFLVVGDFNNDGRQDAVTARRDGDALNFFKGDGHGNLQSAERISLDGKVAALIAGELNRKDGLRDLAVGLVGADGARVLIFEGWNGALSTGGLSEPPALAGGLVEPESFVLPTAATAFAVVSLAENGFGDLAIAAGNELLVLHGRDRQLTLNKESRRETAAVISRHTFEAEIIALTTGRFTDGTTNEIAVLTENGSLHAAKEGKKGSKGEGNISSTQVFSASDHLPSSPAQLLAARVSANAATDDLILLDDATHKMHVLKTAQEFEGLVSGEKSGQGTTPPEGGTLNSFRAAAAFEGAPIVALPMRLNKDGLDDIVFLSVPRALAGGPEEYSSANAGYPLANAGFPPANAVGSDLSHLAPSVALSAAVATFIVNSTGNNGDINFGDNICSDGTGNCTLRAAIQQANARAGSDEIRFNIPGVGPHTISPTNTTLLSSITDTLTIDGTTQPGFNGTPLIELNGANAGGGAGGLRFGSSGTNCVLRGLVINRFSGSAIDTSLGNGSTIEGNFIGTNASGTAALGNGGAFQAAIRVTSLNNTIGGTTAAARNVISGNNGPGVEVSGGLSAATGNKIQGNYVGTNASGTAKLANVGRGVVVTRAQNNTIGGTPAGARNVISGNGGDGLGILGSVVDAVGNVVQNNLIGTDKNGTAAIANGGHGVLINGVSQCQVGGTAAGAGNVISGNAGSGLEFLGATKILLQANRIGTRVNGTEALGNVQHGLFLSFGASDNTIGGTGVTPGLCDGPCNIFAFNGGDGVNFSLGQVNGANSQTAKGQAIDGDRGVVKEEAAAGDKTSVRGNSFESNGGKGIGGVDPNVTAGPNNGQPPPELMGLERNDKNLTGEVKVDSPTDKSKYPLDIEVFLADLSGIQGTLFLGATSIAASDAQKVVPFSLVNIAHLLPPGSKVVATATDADRNTSVFSLPAEVKEKQPCTYTVDPVSIKLSASDSGSQISVTTQAGCEWKAASEETFIQVFVNGGTGSGLTSFGIQPNDTGATRPSTLKVAGQTVKVTQEACTYTVNPTSIKVPVSNPFNSRAIDISVDIKTEGRCPWKATSDSAFIRGGGSGSGKATVPFLVDANIGPDQRPGTLTIAGQKVTVTQDACSYRVTASPRVSAYGTETIAEIETSPPCKWEATFSPSDMGAIIPSSGTGSSSPTLLIQPNERLLFLGFLRPAPARSAKITITGGASATVFQPGINAKSDFDGDNNADKATAGVGKNSFGSAGNLPAFTAGRENISLTPGGKASETLALQSLLQPETQVNWVINNSSDGSQRTVQFGLDTDKIVPGDYNGDSKADLAVWRPSTGTWFIAKPTGVPAENFDAIEFGLSTDIPVQADYDGDGKTDIAVFRPSDGDWRIRQSSDNQVRVVHLGFGTDRLVPADYDGDGKADPAFWRPSDQTWQILQSSNNSPRVVQFGASDDRPAPGDYDGDFKTDIAVFRPSDGTWRILRSSDNSLLELKLGLADDVLVPADYDGDLKTDVAVFRPSDGTWRILRSSDGITQIQQFGQRGDVPIPSALFPQPMFQAAVLTTGQAEIKTWTLQGRTFAYVKLLFPNAGFRVADFGSSVRSGSDFSANALVERFTGASVQAVTTTAQIYDLGPLADGTYNFNFKTSGTLAKTLQFTVSSTVPPPNPIDNAREFVKQLYRDFLNREADQAGEDFWTDNITRCSDPARRPAGQTEAQCTVRQRETTSGAFFLSPEFQDTGYFVYRMYQGALGRQPKLSEFVADTQFVANGIIVNGQLSAAKINQNKAAFAQQFVNCTDATKPRCAEFKAIYDGLSNPQFVDKLFQTTGVNATATDRIDLVNSIGASQTRGSIVQKVVDGINVIAEGQQEFTTSYGQAFYNAEFNRAFVQLEYFGYLKRDPDEAGYVFWLGKLNQFSGNFVNAEMVLAFISSPEYRARFGQP